jgi:hypothetical protein
MTMSTLDNWPSGTTTDSGKQVDHADTLNSIMAQLTSIGSHLNLQGAMVAHHALLLYGVKGSTPPINNAGAQGQGSIGHGSGNSGGAKGGADESLRTNHHLDNHVDLCNSSTGPSSAFHGTMAPPTHCHG